jgi:prepilin-type N-terminal cleavage/methylation domain-containing protein
MNIKSNKGFTLLEVVLVVSILSLISTIIYSVFQFGIDSYYSGSRQVLQQDKVMDIIQMIRSQVEEAKTVKYDNSNDVLILSNENLSDSEMIDSASASVFCWKFQDEKLMFRKLGQVGYEDLVYDIDTSDSSFDVNSEEKLIINIKPINLNEKYKNRNILTPVVEEISVRYKIAN